MQRRRFWATINAILPIIFAMFIIGNGVSGAVTYKTLYRYTSDADGRPGSFLTSDSAGNLYGVTTNGGLDNYSCCGTVFELVRNPNGSWKERVLYRFMGGIDGIADGMFPQAGVTFDSLGNLYGVTWEGGTGSGWGCSPCGTVFKLTPNPGGTWTESVIHSFNYTDGHYPTTLLTFDASGNLYGGASDGGAYGNGVVFELSPNADGTWSETVLKSFNGLDGLGGPSSVVFDKAGNLYGTTEQGGPNDLGTVFELTPNPDGSWTHIILHSFPNFTKDGVTPYTGLILDQAGNLYGTTAQGSGPNDGSGTVFKLVPNADGTWSEHILHFFDGAKNGAWPETSLIADPAGNLYGTTRTGGAYGYGLVYELVHLPKGGWAERVLWSFQDRPGAYPRAVLLPDGKGNFYGTTQGDGTNTFGTVFEVTP